MTNISFINIWIYNILYSKVILHTTLIQLPVNHKNILRGMLIVLPASLSDGLVVA